MGFSFCTREKEIPTAPLLPLVDILFTAVGIFLILITVNTIVRTTSQMPPAQADVVLLTMPSMKFTVFTPENPQGTVYPFEQFSQVFKSLIESRKNLLKILLAFGPDDTQVSKVDLLLDYIDKIKPRLIHKNARGSKLAAVQTMLWPLPEGKNQLPPLVRQWQRRVSGKVGSTTSK